MRGIRFIGCVFVLALGVTAADSQPPVCVPFRVNPSFLNVMQEPRDNAPFIDMLESGDIVCVKSDRMFGGKQWGHILFRVAPSERERRPVDGWVPMQNLTAIRPPHEMGAPGQMAPAEQSAAEAATIPDTASVSSPDLFRFDQPVPFGPVPVNGKTLAELTNGIPLFAPLKGVDNASWQKQCPSCHKWDREMLCKQGGIYLADPRIALRQPHPYGPPFSVALMRWAKNGCQ